MGYEDVKYLGSLLASPALSSVSLSSSVSVCLPCAEAAFLIVSQLNNKAFVYAAKTVADPRGIALDRTADFVYVASRSTHQVFKISFAPKPKVQEAIVGDGTAGTARLTTSVSSGPSS